MQRRYFGYPSTGWNTTSQEYLDHVRRMERSPTIVIDVPQYPSAHAPINNSVTREEAREVHRPHKNYHTHNQKQHAPEVVHKKVQFAKDDKIIDKGKTESNEVKSINSEADVKSIDSEVEVKGIDSEADDFIRRKHKNFEMSKWATFKTY